MKKLSPLSVALPFARPELTGSPLQSLGALYMAELVYFFKHNNIDAVKIGLTKSDCIKRRFTVFSTYSPFGGEILGYIETENSNVLERLIHEVLSDLRINNKREWFKLKKDEAIEIILKNKGTKYSGHQKAVAIKKEYKKIEVITNKKNTIISMYKSGLKQVDIARQLNTPKSYVSKIIHNNF